MLCLHLLIYYKVVIEHVAFWNVLLIIENLFSEKKRETSYKLFSSPAWANKVCYWLLNCKLIYEALFTIRGHSFWTRNFQFWTRSFNLQTILSSLFWDTILSSQWWDLLGIQYLFELGSSLFYIFTSNMILHFF